MTGVQTCALPISLNLERDSVGAVILGEYEHISEGDPVKCTGRILDVPVGPELIGRVVDSLGRPIDGKGPVNAKLRDVIEKVAPGVMARQAVNQPLQTGLKSIDAMVPIGRTPVHRTLFRLHDGRIFPRSRSGRADNLRRLDQAGLGVPSGVAAAAPSAGQIGRASCRERVSLVV